MAKPTGTDAHLADSAQDQSQDVDAPETESFFDPDTFREFADLFGHERARFWLADFRDGLVNEFAHTSGQIHDLETSRANIHKFCARAGMIGFKALQEACFHFLEDDGESEAAPDDAYQRVRTQAELVYPEIKRLRALLT